MRSILHFRLLQAKQYLRIILIFGVILTVVVALVFVGYRYNWTGFSESNQISISRVVSGMSSGKVTEYEVYQSGKTLWDWLQLLIIPVVIAVSGYFINFTLSKGEQEATKQRAKTEQKIAEDNQRAAALQTYIDKLSELLLEKKLRDSKPEDETRKIARVRTLTVLPRLDRERKRSLLLFLYELGLIEKDNPIVVLSGADLSGANLNRADLRKINLTGTNLIRSDFWMADLSGTNLSEADLRETNLSEADLSETNLSGANLSWSDLFKVDLSEADLSEATFIEVDMSNAKLSKATLSRAMLSRINLSEADLNKADLSEADLESVSLISAKLSGANMSGAKLRKVDLSSIDLRGANLNGAKLIKVNLRKADLREANLSRVDLKGAVLEGADLGKADLSEANLSGATVTVEQCGKAKSLKGATMPDGTIYP